MKKETPNQKMQMPKLIPKIIQPELFMCGGISKSAPATQEIKDYLQKHLHLLKKDYLEKTKSEIKKVEAISFKKQTIDGWNTWITCKVNGEEMVEFFIYEHHSGVIRDAYFRKLE